MLILSIRTDNPDAEIGLFDDERKLDYLTWQAHRQLSETLLIKITELLKNNNFVINDLKGIIVYEGPGSFTGLRIGISAANALSYSLGINIASGTGDNWLNPTLALVKDSQLKKVLPEYGALPHITQAKK